jgi:hypothetical protein
MRRYSGERTIDGIVVTVDGKPLDKRFDIRVFDEKGFEWSYEGSARRQLALAILADHYGDADMGSSKVEPFVTSVIANLDNDWELTSSDIDEAVT